MKKSFRDSLETPAAAGGELGANPGNVGEREGKKKFEDFTYKLTKLQAVDYFILM